MLPAKGYIFHSTSPGCLLNPQDKGLQACWVITQVVVNQSSDAESRLTVCRLEIDGIVFGVPVYQRHYIQNFNSVKIIYWFQVFYFSSRDVFKMHGFIRIVIQYCS